MQEVGAAIDKVMNVAIARSRLKGRKYKIDDDSDQIFTSSLINEFSNEVNRTNNDFELALIITAREYPEAFEFYKQFINKV